MHIITSSADETYNFGVTLAKKSHGGDIYGLVGDLGGGKTTFTKGFAAGLGVRKLVTSPTYILMNVFPVHRHGSITRLCHVDTYRMHSPEEIIELGLLEHLGEAATVTIIEWADALLPILKPYYHTLIHFEFVDEHSRKITVSQVRRAIPKKRQPS